MEKRNFEPDLTRMEFTPIAFLRLSIVGKYVIDAKKSSVRHHRLKAERMNWFGQILEQD